MRRSRPLLGLCCWWRCLCALSRCIIDSTCSATFPFLFVCSVCVLSLLTNTFLLQFFLFSFFVAFFSHCNVLLQLAYKVTAVYEAELKEQEGASAAAADPVAAALRRPLTPPQTNCWHGRRRSGHRRCRLHRRSCSGRQTDRGRGDTAPVPAAYHPVSSHGSGSKRRVDSLVPPSHAASFVTGRNRADSMGSVSPTRRLLTPSPTPQSSDSDTNPSPGSRRSLSPSSYASVGRSHSRRGGGGGGGVGGSNSDPYGVSTAREEDVGLFWMHVDSTADVLTAAPTDAQTGTDVSPSSTATTSTGVASTHTLLAQSNDEILPARVPWHSRINKPSAVRA